MKTPKQSDTKAEQIWHDFLNTLPPLIQTSKGIAIYKAFREQHRENYLYAAIKSCACKGYSMEETVKVLRQYFGYILPDDFAVEVFEELLYIPKLADAWGSNIIPDLDDRLVQDKALSLALKTGSMQDLESYVKMYGSTLRVEPESEPTEGTSKPQEITFKLSAS